VRTDAIVKGYQMPAQHGQCGAFGGQASDKPQGRKPRAAMGTAVPRAGAMGISELRTVEWAVGVIAGEGRLGEIVVAERAEAVSELRLASPRV
jgi:hypothetical protein